MMNDGYVLEPCSGYNSTVSTSNYNSYLPVCLLAVQLLTRDFEGIQSTEVYQQKPAYLYTYCAWLYTTVYGYACATPGYSGQHVRANNSTHV